MRAENAVAIAHGSRSFAFVFALGGCFAPAIPSGAFRCAPEGTRCPDGQECIDGMCVDPDEIEAGVPDGSPDGPVVKGVPDLEGEDSPGNVSCLDGSSEAPDTYATAKLIAPGPTTSLEICWAGDIDYYRVTVGEGQRLRVIVSFVHAQGDIDAVLQGPNAAPLLLSFGQSTDDNEELSLDDAARQEGDYRIAVYGWQDATNEYSLDVQLLDF